MRIGKRCKKIGTCFRRGLVGGGFRFVDLAFVLGLLLLV